MKQNQKTSQKLLKLKDLLEKSTISKTSTFPILSNKKDKKIDKLDDKLSIDLSKDFSLYLSIIQKPINLLFSIDQFLFEFSKKSYQQKKTGEFFQQLKERKKLSLFYGHLTKKQILNLFNKVKKNKGYFSKNVFSILERRLDIVLYRSGITKTIAEARQLIKHKKVLVNKNIVNIPSFLLNPGDIVSTVPETMDILSNQLLKSLDTKPLKNHPKIFGDFYSKLKKIKESETREVNFQSKSLSHLFTLLICTKVKLRSFLNLNKDYHYSNNFFQIDFERNILAMVKWKSTAFFTKKATGLMKFFETQNEKKFKQKQSFSKLKNQYHDLNYANQGCLQKKPLFWNRNLSCLNKNAFLLINNPKNLSKSKKDLKKMRISNYKKKNLALYRNNFLVFVKNLENYTKLTNFLTLNIKKSLFKKPLDNFFKNLTFKVIKPMHLEVSYNLLNVIYLYSPQRLNFPFYIDLDLIHRSLR